LEKIFSGEIYEILPQSSGVVFTYCKGASEDRVLVAYKMVSVDNGIISDVAKNIYLLSKFGSNYHAAADLCSNYVTARSVVLPSGRVFACTENGTAYLIDGDGLPIWSGELNYKGSAPSDIAIHKNSLWACYSKEGVLLRFNLNTMREELRIGGKNSPFEKPVNIFIEDNIAVVSNAGSNKLLKVDLNSYTVTDYKEFTEAVYGYVKIKNFEFVLLKSGLYVL